MRSAAAVVIYTSPRANPPVPDFGAIAQLGERYNGIVEVSGSIPLGSTKFTPWETRGFFFFELDRRCDIFLVMDVWVKLGVK